MPPVHSTLNIDLTEAEDTYLRSCIVNYRSTPPPEKDAFRDNCVKYIMRQRGVSDNDVYALHLLRLKVKNWFQNHARKGKSVRLPMRINQGFSPMRVWALLNEATIRKSVEEQKGSAPDSDDRGRLANWNATKRQLWERLPEADRRVYERLAEKWAMEGPDEAIKPVLAEKRSPSWMCSVAHLFWVQCKMPLFMYGMYKDKDGVLHAVVYDTSNLWREKDKSTPLFRNLPGWDQDFRRVAWTYFQAILRPDLAATETLQVMKASKRNPPAPISFLRHDDQCPILFHKEGEGKEMINSRRQEIFREFIKAHYNLAVGREMRSAPWSSMHDRPSMFFEAGMLPDGFVFNDPSHIGETLLIPFFEHVIAMECPTSPDVPPRRFRFYQFERGSGDNRTYHPAVYNGIVEPAAPRRTKKAVAVPEFEDPPTPGSSHVPDDTDDLPEPSTPLGHIPAAFASALDAARAEVRAEMAAEAAEGSRGQVFAPHVHSHTANDSSAAGRPIRSAAATSRSLPPSLDISPWLASEIDAAARHSNEESELSEEEYTPPVDDEVDDGDDGDDIDDDDEVEGFLNDLGPIDVGFPLGPAVAVVSGAALSSDPGTSARPAASSSPAEMQFSAPTPTAMTARASPALLPSPAQVVADVPSRLSFLQSLSTVTEYVALLHRVDHGLRSVASIRAQNPVFWATWGHKSPHVPEVIHTAEKKAIQLLKWIGKEREMTANAVDIQRFCLVVGMCLRDLDLIDTTDGTAMWPEDVPGFMAVSSLDNDARASILEACGSAFTDEGSVAEKQVSKGKAKGRAMAQRPSGDGTAAAGLGTPSNELGTPTPARRSTRSAGCRT